MMFGILKNPGQPDQPFELIYYDLLSESEREEEFEKLQRLEIVFNGYFPLDENTPTGLNPQVHEALSAVVKRLNKGEELTPDEIRELLAEILV